MGDDKPSRYGQDDADVSDVAKLALIGLARQPAALC